MKPFSEMMLQQMLFMDGAMHARLRGICSAAITPRKVEELRAVIESIANGLIDKFIAKGRMDMLADFANPLPAIVTATMLVCQLKIIGSSGPGSSISLKCLAIFNTIPIGLQRSCRVWKI